MLLDKDHPVLPVMTVTYDSGNSSHRGVSRLWIDSSRNIRYRQISGAEQNAYLNMNQPLRCRTLIKAPTAITVTVIYL